MAKKPGPPKGVRIGGRKKGTPNKATAEIKDIARQYGPDALKRLVHLAKNAESEQAQVAACREILDRAYGRPAQAIVGSEDDPPVKTVMEIVWGGSSASG